MNGNSFPSIISFIACIFGCFIFEGRLKIHVDLNPVKAFRRLYMGYDKVKYIRLFLSILCVSAGLIISFGIHRKTDDEPVYILSFLTFVIILLIISLNLDKNPGK